MEDIECADKNIDCAAMQLISNNNAKIAVLGIGNLLLSDEGIGIHIVQNLINLIDPDKVEIIDGGTAPDIFSLINRNIENLIVIDAANAGDKPGSIFRLNIEDIDSKLETPFSLHDMGLEENLKLLPLLNPRLKSITIIGIQVGNIDLGLEPSREVSKKIPRIIQVVLEEIEKVAKYAEVKQ